MISRDMKRKIDMVLDILWEAGITSTVVALEQITCLMFIRLLDERSMNDADKHEAGLRVLCELEPGERLLYIQQRVRSLEESCRWGANFAFELIRDAAELQNLSVRTLQSVVDVINSMDLSGRDVMGDACEYLLNKAGDVSRRGQFRTPSHIIDMVVELMKPSVDDRILDPAAGTAGFLLSSASYIAKHHEENGLTEEERERYRVELLSGFDVDLAMLRIGVMNMLLEGIDMHIDHRNALFEDNEERERYSLILANPPFAGRVAADHVSKDLLDFGRTEKAELLFMILCLKMLKVGGRCACIVPSGALFGTTETHVAIRRELVEKQKLSAVIAMPAGVFRPYTRVNTAVLIFEKTNAGGTDRVWFYDMEADGYSLDDRRSEIADNDIPDIIARFSAREVEEGRARTEKSFMVSKEEIKANGYVLSVRRYREAGNIMEEQPTTFEIMSNLRELDEQITQTMEEIGEMLGM